MTVDFDRSHVCLDRDISPDFIYQDGYIYGWSDSNVAYEKLFAYETSWSRWPKEFREKIIQFLNDTYNIEQEIDTLWMNALDSFVK